MRKKDYSWKHLEEWPKKVNLREHRQPPFKLGFHHLPLLPPHHSTIHGLLHEQRWMCTHTILSCAAFLCTVGKWGSSRTYLQCALSFLLLLFVGICTCFPSHIQHCSAPVCLLYSGVCLRAAAAGKSNSSMCLELWRRW